MSDLSCYKGYSTKPSIEFVDLYRFYLGLVLRVNSYYFAVVGAVLVYAGGKDSFHFVQQLLLLPATLSFFQSIHYICSLKLASQLHEQQRGYLISISSQTTEARSAPSMTKGVRLASSSFASDPLWWMLLSFSVVHCGLFIGIIYMFINYDMYVSDVTH